MERRELIRSLMITGLGVSLRVPISDLWCTAGRGVAAGEEFAAIVDAIIPETDTPGAVAAGVPEFILSAITKTDDPGYAERFEAGWAAFKAESLLKHETAFHVLSPDQRIAHLTSLAELNDEFFNDIRRWTIIGYFTSEIGMTQSLTYNPVPGKYLPCVEVTDQTRGEATYS